MRYNENVYNYSRYIEEMEEETKIQKQLYKKIGITRHKIEKLQNDIASKTSEPQINRLLKLIDGLYKDINKYSTELEYSKLRQRFFEQKVCNHDFGVVINEFLNEEGHNYSSGICLECDAELNEIEGKIFTHSINITKETSGVYNVEDYKKRLNELKGKYEYYNSNYDYDLGEQIVSELYSEAKTLKKKYSRL